MKNGAYEFCGMVARETTIEAINRYVEHRIEPGSFVTAVLENDLKNAVGRADGNNMCNLPAIVSYCYNEIPADAWGSPDKVTRWLATDFANEVYPHDEHEGIESDHLARWEMES